ncbi:MAG: glycosyltransferase family 4 protein [Ruminococcaceae bacterium]|nr:glycosyltransferase family 4 protein [Oscillospiraceae bacterium]
MKLLFIAQRFHTNQFPIIKGLIDAGHEVNYIVQTVGTSEDHSILVPEKMKLSLFGKMVDKHYKKKLDATAYESKMTENTYPSFGWMFRRIKALRPDVVILRYRTPATLTANLVCKLLGIKTVLYNQTALYSKKGKKQSFKSKIIFALLPKVRMTTVEISDVFDLKYHRDEHYIKEHDYFLPYIFEPSPEAADRSYFKDGKLNILDVGKYRPYKNHFVLARAVKVMKDRGWLADIRFTILGQAGAEEEKRYMADLQKYIDDNEIGEYITLRTHIPYNQMRALYLENDIFILTSKEEQASITILESMGNAIMSISTNVNGTASYIKEGETGFFFETDNEENLAECLKYISDNRDKVPEWGKNGYEDIKNNYGFENYSKALFGVLSKEFGLGL